MAGVGGRGGRKRQKTVLEQQWIFFKDKKRIRVQFSHIYTDLWIDVTPSTCSFVKTS